MKRLFLILSGALFLSSTLTAGDLSAPMPFVPVTPCRQYNSLSATPLPDNTSRTVTLSGAPCGIPATAVAVAVNIAVLNISGAVSSGEFKVGLVSPPTMAWISYPSAETQRGNAGVLSLTGAGAIVVQVNQGGGQVDFVVDVFGYYGPTPAISFNTFSVILPTTSSTAILGKSLGGGIGVQGDAFGAGGWGVLGQVPQTASGYTGSTPELASASWGWAARTAFTARPLRRRLTSRA